MGNGNEERAAMIVDIQAGRGARIFAGRPVHAARAAAGRRTYRA